MDLDPSVRGHGSHFSSYSQHAALCGAFGAVSRDFFVLDLLQPRFPRNERSHRSVYGVPAVLSVSLQSHLSLFNF